MIKPYFKHSSNFSLVEVEDHGVINLTELPIKVREGEEGHYELGWVSTSIEGESTYILSEYGGKSSLTFGGRNIGVLRELVK
ncbi:hypothetical protein PQ478_09010 [Alkalihalophilus pseudofirmus]|uniref:hypothetical protein n=1 Tax=Alkalihalophilus pseudofirmus TaxID=79885 RepID=UPI00259B6B85|nr:hypothetical protein [Alkalihalophilus pseudofirmus]WEG18610.1 hypothetical protein PQ478_09010 [Alkalihalophilus pseudofirmus]